jgi:DNA-binding MarR family transcriptional regulator
MLSMFPVADSVADLIAETFRVNGRLLSAADALVADLGLTAARLQVLGAIAVSPVALPVAHIARNLGLTRQAVQRLVDEMERDSLVRFEANPHHQRAKLVLLTASGRDAYDAAMKHQASLARKLTQGLTVKQIRSATAVLKTMRRRLENSGKATKISAKNSSPKSDQEGK